MSFSEFLTALIQSLDQEGLRLQVLRSYEGFPTHNTGRDVDLLIRRSELPCAIRAIGTMRGIRIVGYAERHFVATLLLQGVSTDPAARAIQVDFYLSLTWKGLPFLATDVVLRAATPRHAGSSTFFVPSPVHEAIISLFAGLLLAGSVKEKYFPEVRRTFAKARSEVIDALVPQFGLKTSTRLAESVLDGDLRRVLACVTPLRASLAWRSLLHRPLRSVQDITRHYRLEFAARFTPQDLESVSILSLAGCEKTTIIESLLPMLRSSSVVIEMRRSGPILLQVRQSKEMTSTIDYPPEARAGYLVSTARILCWLLKEWVSQFTGKALPTLRICESYYYDLLVDPNSYQQGCPIWIARLVGKLLPAGDLWILLDSPTGSLQAVRPDMAPSEILSKLEAYRSFVRTRKRLVILDASGPAASVAENAYTAIIDTLAERADRKLKNRFQQRKTPN